MSIPVPMPTQAVRSVDQRDLVGRVFQFEEVRPVPYWLFGLKESETGMAKSLDDYYGSRDWRNDLHEGLVGHHVGFIKESLGDGQAMDTFGVLLREGSTPHVLRHPLLEPSLKGFDWPDPDEMVDWEELRRFYSAREDRFRLCGLAMGLFERSWFLRGFENAMVDMVQNPAFYEELLDGILAVQLRFMDLLVSRVPIEGYFGGDDVSDQQGVIMGMERWRRYFKPREAVKIAHCHELGLPYVHHACGNVLPLVDDLIEIGLDGLESLQSEATDVFKVKQQSKGRLVLIGAMGVQSTLFSGKPDDVRRDTLRLLNELGQGGGYIVGPSKPLEKEPVENVAAFIDTLINQVE